MLHGQKCYKVYAGKTDFSLNVRFENRSYIERNGITLLIAKSITRCIHAQLGQTTMQPKLSTVKPGHAVTSIKQLPVLKGHLSLDMT